MFSRAALKRFAGQRSSLVQSGKSEDALVARVLRDAQVSFADTRDDYGLERFLPTTLATLRFAHLRETEPKYWLWNFSYYPARDGQLCCSQQWITTHYIQPSRMYELQWTIDAGCDG